MRKEILIWACSLFVASWAAADILVTKDGSRLRTSGSWEVKDRRVVFTAVDGGLKSLFASEIDFEASKIATEEAKAPPRTSRPERERAAVMVFTNKDIGRGVAPIRDTEASLAQVDQAEEDVSASEESLSPVGVQVVSWEERRWERRRGESFDGIEIYGVLSNESQKLVTALKVTVRLLDMEGEELGRRSAFLGLTSLAPRGSTTFRALFPNVLESPSRVEFEIEGRSEDLSVGAERD